MSKLQKLVPAKVLTKELARIAHELTEIHGMSVVFSVLAPDGKCESALVSLPDGQAPAQQMVEHLHVLTHCMKAGK